MEEKQMENVPIYKDTNILDYVLELILKVSADEETFFKACQRGDAYNSTI